MLIFKKTGVKMKKITIIMFIMLCGLVLTQAQAEEHNAPVTKSGNMTCNVIRPLSVSPSHETDYLNWPSLPVGAKYYLGGNNRWEDSYSIFTFTGEGSRRMEISIQMEKEKDNVEISFSFFGTQFDHVGSNPSDMTELLFGNNGKEIVSLSAGGNYFLHIIYDWVEAKEGAIPGRYSFIQLINAQYHDL
jgi:hypothetical protein